jgi:hypothetical protein
MSDLGVRMVMNSIILRQPIRWRLHKSATIPPPSFGVIYPSRFLVFRCMDAAVNKMAYGASSSFNLTSCPHLHH